MRVVSLACSNTEIVAALGCADLLVGVDVNSDYPPSVVGELPRVGKDLTIDVEAVCALEPDLVLASLTVPGHEEVVAGIAAAGLPYLAPEPERLSDVYRDIREIAAALGVPHRGEAVARALEDGIESNRVTPGGPRVLVEWWPKPVIVPGRRSWVTDLIEAAGGTSVLGHEPHKSRPITDEEVGELAPDAVVVSWCGVPDTHLRPDIVRRREAWRDCPALIHDRIHVIPEAYLGRPGPRLLDGFVRLREVIRGAQ